MSINVSLMIADHGDIALQAIDNEITATLNTLAELYKRRMRLVAHLQIHHILEEQSHNTT